MAAKRSQNDWLVSEIKNIYYSVYESIGVRYQRFLHEKSYGSEDHNPLVSICVPTYNRAQLLIDRAIDTALKQTYKNFELIIVGDCCTDNTAKLVSKVNDSRIRFYNLPNRNRRYPASVENHWFVGGSVPTNVAMKMARGKWIARLDDDDTWTPTHIEHLLKKAMDENLEFVSAQYIEERHGQQKIVDGIPALDPYYFPDCKIVDQASPKIGGVQTWLYRSYLKFMKYNVDCWRKDWNRVNDVDLSQRIYKAGVRMGFCEEVVAYVLPRPGELSVGLEAYKLTENQKLEHYKNKSSS